MRHVVFCAANQKKTNNACVNPNPGTDTSEPSTPKSGPTTSDPSTAKSGVTTGDLSKSNPDTANIDTSSNTVFVEGGGSGDVSGGVQEETNGASGNPETDDSDPLSDPLATSTLRTQPVNIAERGAVEISALNQPPLTFQVSISTSKGSHVISLSLKMAVFEIPSSTPFLIAGNSYTNHSNTYYKRDLD